MKELFSRTRTRRSDIPRRRKQTDAEQIPKRSAPVFQRNRTITGSTSNKVDGTSGKIADLESPRTLAHRLAQRRKRLMWLLALLLGAAVGAMLLVWQFTAHVTFSHASTKPIVAIADQSQVYSQAVDEYFATRPLERFRFATNEAALLAYVAESHPEIERIRMGGSDGLGVSSILLDFRNPVASWTVADKRYFVDKDGVLFMKNYFSEPTVSVSDTSGVATASGDPVASSRLLSFAGRAVALAKVASHTVTEIRLPPATTRQLEIRLEGVETVVKMTIDRAVGEQVEDMTRSLAYMKANSEAPASVDVRVQGKAYYR